MCPNVFLAGVPTYIRTDMKAHESYSDPDGGVNYKAVRDNVHLQ